MNINSNIESILKNGFNLFQSENYIDAIHEFEKAYILDNQYPKTLYLLGLAYAVTKNFYKAETFLLKALKKNNEDYFINYNLAKVYNDLNLYDKSLPFHKKVIEINPNKYEGWLNYGLSLKNLKIYDQALECFKKSLDLNNNITEVYTSIGDVYYETKDYNKALTNYTKSIELKKNIPEVLTKLGATYRHLRLFDKAIDYHKRAIKYKNNFLEAYVNLAICYRGLFDFKNAILYINKALEINPEFEIAIINKAIIYSDLGELEKSEKYYLQVLKINEHNFEAHTNLGILYLSQLNFKKGWQHYNKRSKTKFGNSILNIEKNTWNGYEKISSLLITSEQGIGDQILYSSMLREVGSVCEKIHLVCDDKLVKVFKNSFVNINVITKEKFKENKSKILFEKHIKIGELGNFFRNDVSKFSNVKFPYIIDNKDITRNLHPKIKQQNKIICGLSWKSTNKEIGINKSIILDKLTNVINIEKIKFVNLQYGDVSNEVENFNNLNKNNIKIIDKIDITNDIESLISVIKNCDFILTTSNTTAHLSAAMNIETLVMVPYGRGKLHYWGIDNTTPWYPSVKIFRQEKNHTWDKTILDVEKYIVNKYT